MPFSLSRKAVVLIATAGLGAALAHAADPLPVQTTRIEVRAGGPVEDIVCKSRARRGAPRKPDADPLEMPSEEEVQELLQSTSSAPAPTARLPVLRAPGERLRVAVWGDSHMAAAFFTDELVRIAGLDAALARPSMLPANFGRPGVRLPLRAHCATGEWRYENAYAVASAAARPGPGLMNMVASEPGAELALDLRTVRGGEAAPLRLLYEGTGAPLRIAVSIDGGAESEVQLQASPGPAALEIAADAPVSQLRLRLVEGTLRLHGLALGPQSRALLQLDVFGYPGATVAGWAKADMAYLRSWFAPDPYDVIVMAYGTNEGNVHPFDAGAYRQSLVAAVANLRESFPAASCVLIGPGDRGVLVRRSQKKARGATAKRTATKATAPRAKAPKDGSGLLRYSRIHQEIDGIQQDVARAAGCSFWSAQGAMGGPGSAYRWGQQGLMAGDLIHFTVKGYQQLAQSFAQAAGWTPATVLPARAPVR